MNNFTDNPSQPDIRITKTSSLRIKIILYASICDNCFKCVSNTGFKNDENVSITCFAANIENLQLQNFHW